MCGITGFIGTNADITKIKLIMLANEVRGKHSCGIYYQNQAFYGVEKQSLVSDFLQFHQIKADKNKPITCVLGHSRQATALAHTSSNAHPFIIRQEDKKLTVNKHKGKIVMKGVHNGKLNNLYTLRNKYSELSDSEFDLDSKVLLGALYINKTNPGEVLKEYEGAAALLYTFDDKSLFAWKGAAGGKEERPLFYLQQEEGFYFSSLAEPLFIINDTDNQVFYTSENTLYKFSIDGTIKSVTYPRAEDKGEYHYNKTNYSGKTNRQTNLSDFSDLPYDDFGRKTSSTKVSNDNGIEAAFIALESYNGAIFGDLTFKRFKYHNSSGIPLTGRFLIDSNGRFDSIRGKEYFFFGGIPLTEEGFMSVAEAVTLRAGDVFNVLSEHALLPVYTLRANELCRNKNPYPKLLYKSNPFSGMVTPLFFNLTYKIRHGIPTGRSIIEGETIRAKHIVVPHKAKTQTLGNTFTNNIELPADDDVEEEINSFEGPIKLIDPPLNAKVNSKTKSFIASDVTKSLLDNALELEDDKDEPNKEVMRLLTKVKNA